MDKKESKMISKGDICLMIIILVLAVIVTLWRIITVSEGLKAVVTVDGDIQEELLLSKDTEVTINSPEGYNIIVVSDGEVTVKEADCRDHICVKHQPISKCGETIICLPHKLVVEVKK